MGIVVEVSIDIYACRQLSSDPFSFRGQLPLGVTAGVVIAMITQVAPLRGHEARMILNHVVNAKSGLMMLQNLEYFGAKPALITELHRETQAAWRGCKKLVEPFSVDAPTGRKLDQYRSECLLETLRDGKEVFESRTRLLQPHEVGTVTIEFDGVAKACGSLGFPAIKRCGSGQVIKSIVDLYRIKVAGIVRKPSGLWQLLWVKNPAPVVVMIA